MLRKTRAPEGLEGLKWTPGTTIYRLVFHINLSTMDERERDAYLCLERKHFSMKSKYDGTDYNKNFHSKTSIH